MEPRQAYGFAQCKAGLDKPTNCSVVFWKLDPSLHFQPMFHSCVYDSTKELWELI